SLRLPAYVRESQKVERLRFPFSALPPPFRCISPKLDHPSLLLMQLQSELSHPFAQFYLEPFGIFSMLEADHDVVCISHHYHCSLCFLLPPSLRPLVEYVVKIDVRKYRAHKPSLRRPFFSTLQLPIFHHSRSEPLLHQSGDPAVPYPVLDHLLQPFVGDGVEKPSNVCIEHPVDWSLLDSYCQCVQRVVRRPPSSESIRVALELRLPDGTKDLRYHTLDDLILHRWYPQSSLSPICFRDIYPFHRRRSIRSSSQPPGQILEVCLKLLSVVLPRLP